MNKQNKFEIMKTQLVLFAAFYIIILPPHRLLMLNGRAHSNTTSLLLVSLVQMLQLSQTIEKPFKNFFWSNKRFSTHKKQSKVYFRKWKYGQKYNMNGITSIWLSSKLAAWQGLQIDKSHIYHLEKPGVTKDTTKTKRLKWQQWNLHSTIY